MEDDEAKEHQKGEGNVSKRNRSSAKKGHKVVEERFNLALGGRNDEVREEKTELRCEATGRSVFFFPFRVCE